VSRVSIRDCEVVWHAQDCADDGSRLCPLCDRLTALPVKLSCPPCMRERTTSGPSSSSNLRAAPRARRLSPTGHFLAPRRECRRSCKATGACCAHHCDHTKAHMPSALVQRNRAECCGGTLRAAGLAKMAIKLAEGSGTRNQWTYEPDEPYADVVRHAPTARQPLALVPDRRQHTVSCTGGGGCSA
jgi:hypothetical protein